MLGAHKAAVEKGYYTMGRFGSRNKSLRPAAKVLSGQWSVEWPFQVWRPNFSVNLNTDAWILLSTSLRGAACKKALREDGQTLYRAMPDDDVCKLLRCTGQGGALCSKTSVLAVRGKMPSSSQDCIGGRVCQTSWGFDSHSPG